MGLRKVVNNYNSPSWPWDQGQLWAWGVNQAPRLEVEQCGQAERCEPLLGPEEWREQAGCGAGQLGTSSVSQSWRFAWWPTWHHWTHEATSTHTHSQTHSQSCPCSHSHPYTYSPTLTLSYIHAHIHTQTYTLAHTHIPPHLPLHTHSLTVHTLPLPHVHAHICTHSRTFCRTSDDETIDWLKVRSWSRMEWWCKRDVSNTSFLSLGCLWRAFFLPQEGLISQRDPRGFPVLIPMLPGSCGRVLRLWGPGPSTLPGCSGSGLSLKGWWGLSVPPESNTETQICEVQGLWDFPSSWGKYVFKLEQVQVFLKCDLNWILSNPVKANQEAFLYSHAN